MSISIVMIDTHTHIFDEQFDEDRAAALARARAVGVEAFILPATMDDEHERLLEVAASENCYWPTIGLHPLAANEDPLWREHLARLEGYLAKFAGRFVAIGETGLDLHWSKDFLSEQIELFVAQIELSISHNLPLVIHTREAWDEILPIMEPYAGQIRGVFHSFVGSQAEVARIEKLGGFMYGINGTVTYPRSVLPEALQHISLDKILLETDSPYLPPQGHRGQRNESSYIAAVAVKVAQIKGISLDEIDEQTTKNAIKMFNISMEASKVSPFLNVKNNI
ncbi:MAG: TatD family hydrolase [Mucinivorans sp.]